MQRTKIVTVWQAKVRRIQSNKRLRSLQALEQAAAVAIQRIVRGKLGRVKHWKAKRNLAAERIQAMWRGIVARVTSDKMWLNKIVVPIQCAIRRAVAKRSYRADRAEVDEAALKIQQRFRMWRAKERQGRFYKLREFDYRQDTIDCIMGIFIERAYS